MSEKISASPTIALNFAHKKQTASLQRVYNCKTRHTPVTHMYRVTMHRRVSCQKFPSEKIRLLQNLVEHLYFKNSAHIKLWRFFN